MATVGSVVIGRNEAHHLPAALASVRAVEGRVVYVDSASSDGSVAIARSAGIGVVELDPASPMSAARARNAGFEALAAGPDAPRFVMFLDGDCELHPGFPASARRMMEVEPRCAIVVGHLTEASTDTSVYGQLSALEWASGAGPITDFGNLGGIMLVRAEAFRAVGGFDPHMIAGEDSELGVRMSLADWSVMKIDAPMASHDNGITGFKPWWRRAVRAGHALAQRYALHGRSRVADCRRELASTLVWGAAIPAISLGLAIPTHGASLLLLGLYGVIGYRMYRGALRAGRPSSLALRVAGFGLLTKFANMQGVLQYARNRWRGSYRIIEYKGPEGVKA
ncbi:GT2 family glycosyltransferase [Sphingomonas jinjuensis]|uniref:GT2 family glycosyltransferase n=1 Tax=Sphingomonas jinjuensis TaxID=535907 RepID=A0A840FB71_9SPHN|nr:glycosyltransferase family 2 protein [Sphingomonas jinjuensis]MBB4153024.1 GT2 family glycosyltransferase [Sphingomonas jinjuensis]